MKFKKLEMNGFKSFADRIEIKFGDGVTAIVGPNGCGKSNVADAIRFVLGEQSSKTLRGGNMQDVIFNGTETRESTSFCEVSMYFDNTERIFKDLNYDEVVFTRKLFRDNESEYMINKNTCRRADIISALRDSGVGKNGYSIIGQGKIDELITSKPENRRSIFDEAAGISKFKAKKEESERSLERTRNNISRINDILNEKNRQLAPILKQADAAAKYFKLSEELKKEEVNIYIHQYETTSDLKAKYKDKRDAIIEEIKQCQAERDDANAKYNATMIEIDSLDNTRKNYYEELNRLTTSAAQNSTIIRHLDETLNELNNKLSSMNSEIVKYEADIKLTEEKISAEKEAIAIKETEKQKLEESINSTELQYNTLNAKIIETEGEEKEGRKALLEAADRLTEIKSNMSQLSAERQGLKERLQSLSDRTKAIIDANSAREREAKRISDEKDTKVKEREALAEQLKNAEARNNENFAKIAVNDKKLKNANNQFNALTERSKILTDLKNDNGFENATTRLLNIAAKDSALNSQIEGVVAKIIEVPKEYETAVEMALGAAINNVITKTEDEAKYIINFLKVKKLGRVTCLPMNVMRPRYIHDDLMRALNMEGCYGVAASLVKYDKKFDSIVRHLLGTVVVVKDMDTGVALARKTRYGFRIVTLDGDIINTSGAMTGGSKKSDVSNVFAHDRNLREADAQLKLVSESIAALELERKELEQVQNILKEDIKKYSTYLHQYDLLIASLNQKYEEIKSEISDAEHELGENQAQLIVWQDRVDKITADIDSVGNLENMLQSQKSSAAAQGQQNEEAVNSLKSERDRLQNQLIELKLEMASVENEINSMSKDLEYNIQNITNYKTSIENYRYQIENTQKEISLKQNQRNETAITLAEKDNVKIEELRQLIVDFDDNKKRLQSSLIAYEAKRNKCMDRFTELSDSKNNEELNLQRVDSNLEMMQARIAENYNMTYEDCLPFRVENFDANTSIEKAETLKRRIDNLGHINPDALEMKEELDKEYNELNEQKLDLEKAEKDLVKVIADLSKDMKTIFDEKFNQINENFKVIFSELFNGGTAELVLLDPEEGKDALSSGIEIKAQPPAKKLQLLSLLSGGEKAMTAIAILFAILKLKPMPFCVLDEIEAALDDANVKRFAKYLKRYSDDTQFIVITHRKPTMELADALYGVTMEKKGISKMVSVKLSDAVKYVKEEKE